MGIHAKPVSFAVPSMRPNGKRRLNNWVNNTETEVHELTKGGSCIRAVLDRETDGDMARRSCQAGKEACGLC
jgi:hypothetical protein